MSENQANYKTRKQTIFRTIKDKDNPFVMIDRRPIENATLSWKAKGVLAYLLSRPDNWIVRLQDLVKRSTDKAHAIRGAIKELQKAGHVHRKEIRGENGQFLRYELEVYELPFAVDPLINYPQADNPQADNRTLNDIDLNDIDLSNGVPPEYPIEWKIAAGEQVTVLPDVELAKRLDFANWVSVGTANPIIAREIAMAFQTHRNMTLPESKVKGQRKAIKEMLEMGVNGVHVTQAVHQLIESGMTITDLFSVSKTAIAIANPTPETTGYNPQGLSIS